MEQQADRVSGMAEILENAIDDERAIFHHRFDVSGTARWRYDRPNLDRFGSREEEIECLGGKLGAGFAREMPGDIGGDAAEQPLAESFKHPLAILGGIPSSRMRSCFAHLKTPMEMRLPGRANSNREL